MYSKYVTYSPTAVQKILDSERSEFAGTKTKYLNTPISFDIETSSFYIGDRKCACMYVWAVDINNNTIIARTWADFRRLIDQLVDYYSLGKSRWLIIYVHNLSYEFQFMRKWFTWSAVFAQKGRRVMYARTTEGVEFRCSYFLYGGKLDTLANEMAESEHSESMLKLKYDYSLMRTPDTDLSADEVEYLIHDVKILTKYITKCIRQEGNITTIPLTKTGYVRRKSKNATLGSIEYRKLIHSMNLTYEEYETAKFAFSGGFTHSNPNHTDQNMDNVASFDFASSYPAVMISEMYPMSSGVELRHLSKEKFEEYMMKELCTCRLTIKNVKPKILNDFYLSISNCDDVKCSSKQDIKTKYDDKRYYLRVSNGRIYSCKSLTTTITSIDYRIMRKVYDFEVESITVLYWYRKHFLPKEIITTILDLYADKTQLKGIPGKEDEYLIAKGMLNSMYGMCVTNIVRDEFPYNLNTNEWEEAIKIVDLPESERSEKINKENKKYSRFLFYLWGIFVTAYARYNLFRGIIECGDDYIYSDTDSLKITNYEKHMAFIKSYNKEITEKCDSVLTYYGIDPERSRPKDKKGKPRQLGIWDFEGVFIRFKTLGAKRYIYFDQGGHLHITIAGVAKTAGANYLMSLWYSGRSENENMSRYEEGYIDFICKQFTRNLIFPAGSTGKMTHTYVDDILIEQVTDYQGHKSQIVELSYIHLESVEYNMTISEEFREFLNWIKLLHPKKQNIPVL